MSIDRNYKMLQSQKDDVAPTHFPSLTLTQMMVNNPASNEKQEILFQRKNTLFDENEVMTAVGYR